MPDVWSIRLARSEELQLLSELAFRSKAHWGYSAAFMDACRAELTVRSEQLGSTFVAELGGRVAGFCTWSSLGAGRAELQFLFVEPSAMQRGCGARLFARACAEARQAGHENMEIQGDPHAAPFYLAMGALQVGERESASVPGRMLPLYEFCLAQ